MYEGLLPFERPPQGRSPLPYLTLEELQDFCTRRAPGVDMCNPAACLPARSDEGARTDSQPAGANLQTTSKNAKNSTPSRGGFSDLRRCSTADQSRLRDFGDSPDGH